MDSISDRLREERERLGLSQTDFGKAGGTSKPSQVRYESGIRTPDAEYLAAIERIGADVFYIVTGRRWAAADSTGASLNSALLREVIAGVETALSELRTPLKPEKKAELIAVLYENFLPAQRVDGAQLERYLKLVA